MKLEMSTYKIAPKITPDQCRVEIIITEQCNHRCSYCYWKDDADYSFSSKNIINKENFKKVIEFMKLQNKDENELTFYGGEPTVHPDLFEFMNMAHKEIPNIEIGVFTNLNKPIEYFKNFPKKDIAQSIIASLHTEFIKDIDGWFDKVALLEPEEVRLVLTKENHNLIFPAYKKYKHLYEDIMVIHPLADYENVDDLMLLDDVVVQIDGDNYSHKDSVEIILKSGERFEGNYSEINNFKGMLCNAGYHIDMRGNVYSCWSAYNQKNILTNLFKDNLKKLSGWTLCTYDHCSCGQRYTKYCPKTYLEKRKLESNNEI